MKVIDSNVGSYVEFNSHELLFLGMSGQPYRGQLFIQYVTDGKAIELLSLKNMIEELRHKKIVLEDISKTIYDIINEKLQNETLCVTVKTTPRGGISSTIRYGICKQMPESKPIVFGV